MQEEELVEKVPKAGSTSFSDAEMKFADEEVNLKEIFYKVIDFFWEAVSFWWLILIVASLMAIKAYRSAAQKPKTYKAVATFMIIDKKEDIRYNDYASLDYGISERPSVQYNLDKIIFLSSSRRVINKALLTKVTVYDSLDYLANHIIREYGLHQLWSGKLKTFYFEHDTITQFSRLEYNALINIFFKVVGLNGESKLVNNYFDSDTGILYITANTTSEDISIALAKEIYSSLANFYMRSESEKQRRIYKMVTIETDSLRGEIVSAQKRLLSFLDRNMGLSLKQFEAKKKGLEEEVNQLTFAFSESFKNLQDTELALLNTVPFIQDIDLPRAPIRPNQPNPIKAAIISAFLWAFLTVLFVIIRRVILNIMNQDMGPHAPFKQQEAVLPQTTKKSYLSSLYSIGQSIWDKLKSLFVSLGSRFRKK